MTFSLGTGDVADGNVGARLKIDFRITRHTSIQSIHATDGGKWWWSTCPTQELHHIIDCFAILQTQDVELVRLRAVIDNKPKGFGEQPEKYHSDVIFLMGIDSAQAIPAFNPREGVDQVWAGDGVIYSQRLSSQRTKSRLNKIMESPLYKSMTIRNWNTTTKLLEILSKMDADAGA